MAVQATPRTLSKREAEIIGWLEAGRRQQVDLAEVRTILGWSDSVARNTVSRLVKKGWLRRTAQGRYESVLAETGGWSVPNAWAALSAWKQRYYVGFKSAAYEHGLTPDRPSEVQVCVAAGAKRPRAWSDIPVVLIFLPKYDPTGTIIRKVQGFDVRIAAPEKLLIDGGALPGRIGGVLGLARVLERAADQIDWSTVVRLSDRSPRGRVALRRLAALLDILERQVPEPLAEAATARPAESALFLGERTTNGAVGERLPQWHVIVNVDRSAIREEVRR
jgi:predicted transcriptional regulator of viral defense system